MKKMTAVEWLEKEIWRRGPIGEDTPTWLKELYEQAKEMEKEQMELCYKVGIIDGSNGVMFKFDKYYKETYKQK